MRFLVCNDYFCVVFVCLLDLLALLVIAALVVVVEISKAIDCNVYRSFVRV